MRACQKDWKTYQENGQRFNLVCVWHWDHLGLIGFLNGCDESGLFIHSKNYIGSIVPNLEYYSAVRPDVFRIGLYRLQNGIQSFMVDWF
jgi:hypothetical protein